MPTSPLCMYLQVSPWRAHWCFVDVMRSGSLNGCHAFPYSAILRLSVGFSCESHISTRSIRSQLKTSDHIARAAAEAYSTKASNVSSRVIHPETVSGMRMKSQYQLWRKSQRSRERRAHDPEFASCSLMCSETPAGTMKWLHTDDDVHFAMR